MTCHFIDLSLHSVVLGVLHFPDTHTVENVAKVKAALMSEWGITHRVTCMCLVTNGAANMGACAKANGPPGTEADSRGGYTVEQHIQYAPTCLRPQGTFGSSFSRPTH